MIIIGSRALSSYFEIEKFEQRLKKSDFDVIMSYEDFFNWCNQFKDDIVEMFPKSHNKYNVKIMKNGKKIQYEIELGFENTSSLYLLDNIEEVTDNTLIDNFGIKWHCLSLPYLMLMKKSHLYFPVHFFKNINDYHFIKEHIGEVNENDIMKTFFNLRKKEAVEKFKNRYSTPKLNMSNEDFFKISGKSKGRVFIHDDLHKIVQHFDKPIYEMLKHKNKSNLAWCEKDLFFNLPFEYQIKCVQEEAYVIALERYIIPKIGEYENLFWCYERALMRICTTLCSGFFRDFAFENYPKILKSYSKDFYDKFIFAYKNNIIKPMKGRKLEQF